MAKKPRRNISTVVAGKAITEDEVFVKIQEYKSVSEQTKSKCSKKIKQRQNVPQVSPQKNRLLKVNNQVHRLLRLKIDLQYFQKGYQNRIPMMKSLLKSAAYVKGLNPHS